MALRLRSGVSQILKNVACKSFSRNLIIPTYRAFSLFSGFKDEGNKIKFADTQIVSDLHVWRKLSFSSQIHV